MNLTWESTPPDVGCARRKVAYSGGECKIFFSFKGRAFPEGSSCFCLTLSYNHNMTTTITFRLPASERRKLRRRAKLLGKTESELLRELVKEENGSRPMAERLKGLKGVLSSKGVKLDARAKEIHERNWRW